MSVRLTNISKHFPDPDQPDKGVMAVEDCNLHIQEGELVTFLGPSGCGKTTTLRIISGFEMPTTGSVYIDDKDVTSVPPNRRDTSMVFQSYAIFPHLSVSQNIGFGLSLRKFPKEQIEKEVREIMKLTGLEALYNRRPDQLSGGQQQRVALARAIINRPRVLLFDEPLSNLDAKLRTQMRTEMKLLHQKVKATIVYVTHDQVEAMTLADRIVVMRDGYIEQIGRPIELFEKPANTFVAGFIGSPPMNLIPARIISKESRLLMDFQGKLHIPIPERKDAAISDGMDIIMGIRTEDFTIDSGTNGFPPDWMVEGTVEVVEPLGGETNMHMDINGIKFTAKSEGRRTIEVGSRLKLALNLEHLHIFDAASTQSVY